MKIFKLPKSRMSAIKDRTVCVPIDDTTIENTMLSLPRTPNEANLLPVKLKRKKSFKGSHLEEYINVYKAKRSKTEEFLQNLLFNLNYIQYKILELQFIINE